MKKLVNYLTASILLLALVTPSAFAYDFSAVCESGQTLYYNITSNVEPYTVKVTFESCNESTGLYNLNNYPTGDLIIPESVSYEGKTYSVTEIGYSAFAYCTGLVSVTIPNSVTTICAEAFSPCHNIESVTLSNSVIIIGARAFEACFGLLSIDIPNSVAYIENHAFASCGLTSLTIPYSVTSIGEGAFYGCSSLDTIYCNAINPPSLVSANTFPSEILKIFVPCDCLSAYTNAEYWSELTNILQEHPDCPSSKVHENEISDLHIFPNPTNNIITITSPEEISEIEIVNVIGQVVYRTEVNADNAICNVEGLTAGVYFVRIRALRQAQGAEIQQKFIKE